MTEHEMDHVEEMSEVDQNLRSVKRSGIAIAVFLALIWTVKLFN